MDISINMSPQACIIVGLILTTMSIWKLSKRR